MELVVDPDGRGPARSTPRRSTWPRSGRPAITRASHVEPDADGRWHADLRPVAARCSARSRAAARPWRPSVAWLEAHWLAARRPDPPVITLVRPIASNPVTNPRRRTAARRACVPGRAAVRAAHLEGARP